MRMPATSHAISRLLTVFAATTMTFVAAAPAAADEWIASESRETPLTAHGDLLAWSHYDEKANRYRLVVRSSRGIETPRIRSRRVPFDADIGPGPGGRPVVTYSRCRVERLRSGFQQGLNPGRDRARGCDLYLLDVGSGRERRIRSGSRRDASEYFPTMWGSRLAFVRIYERRRGRAGFLPHLIVRDLRSGRETRLRASTRGVYGQIDDDTFEGGPGPGTLDLRGRTLAFGWESYQRRCGGRSSLTGDLVLRAEVWAVSLSGRRHRLAVDCRERSTLAPAFSGNRVFYLTDFTRALTAVDPRTRRRSVAALEPSVVWATQAGGDTFMLRLDLRGGFELVRADPPLEFAPTG